jgi:hypothetical protein
MPSETLMEQRRSSAGSGFAHRIAFSNVPSSTFVEWAGPLKRG